MSEEKKRKLKCSDEDYADLQRARDALFSLKALYREWERERDEALALRRMETAEFLSGMMMRAFESIRNAEKRIKELEEKCFGE